MKRPYLWLLLVVLVGAAAWFGWVRFNPPPTTTLTKHDGTTIDPSLSQPVVKPPAPPLAVTSPVNLTKPDNQVIDLNKPDYQTVDYSSGKAVVKVAPEDRAALEKAAREMEEAVQSITFEAPKKKTEPPPAPPKK